MKFEPESIVCYGIGHFGTSTPNGIPAPLWQLSFALELRWHFSLQDRSTTCFFFDPCTTEKERKTLEYLGISWIETNERGKRSVDSRPTLFFMPHCPMMLYENVLLENWFCLQNLVLIGNSLKAYSERTFGQIPPGISLLIPHLREEPLVCTSDDLKQVDLGAATLETAFNDTFVTSFIGWNEDVVLPRPGPSMGNREDGRDNDDDEVL